VPLSQRFRLSRAAHGAHCSTARMQWMSPSWAAKLGATSGSHLRWCWLMPQQVTDANKVTILGGQRKRSEDIVATTYHHLGRRLVLQQL